jgi:radical SAM superfamily enzyme YgiQ (UPF0313 family)
MTDVLLISPPFKGLLREPIGLYYLAGVLNSNGIKAQILDFNIELPTKLQFRELIKKVMPKIIGLTSYTFNFSITQKIAEEIKIIEPNIITVLGGVHASAIPYKILKNNNAFDYIVIGEGEITFLDLCKKVLDYDSAKNINGIAIRKRDEVILNPPRSLIKDLDELPIPNRELIPMKKYPVASVQTSRGCPYNCIFCNINRFYGKKFRLRDPKMVVKECELVIKRYETKNIFFFGDDFTFDSGWVEELCDEIKKRNLNFIWGCETRTDNVNLSLLQKMREAGCIEVQYGIDYGDEDVLKKLGKEMSIDCINDAVKWAKEAGLFIGGFFIFDVPEENENTMENTFQLIQRLPIDAIEVNLLTPYPGTPLGTNPKSFDMKIIENNFDCYTTKKYVMENIQFPKDRFIPAFKTLLKRLNFIPTPGNRPEILDFLKKDVKIKLWR